MPGIWAIRRKYAPCPVSGQFLGHMFLARYPGMFSKHAKTQQFHTSLARICGQSARRTGVRRP